MSAFDPTDHSSNFSRNAETGDRDTSTGSIGDDLMTPDPSNATGSHPWEGSAKVKNVPVTRHYQNLRRYLAFPSDMCDGCLDLSAQAIKENDFSDWYNRVKQLDSAVQPAELTNFANAGVVCHH